MSYGAFCENSDSPVLARRGRLALLLRRRLQGRARWGASRSAVVETELFGHPLGQDQPPTVTECDHASRLDERVGDDDLAPVQPVCDVVKPEPHDLGIPQHDMFMLAHNTKAVRHAQ